MVLDNYGNFMIEAIVRAAERIIGPWGSFNFGPLVYLSLYMLCCMKGLQRGTGGTPPEKNFKNT